MAATDFKVQTNKLNLGARDLEHNIIEQFPESLKLTGSEITLLLIITLVLVFLTAWIHAGLEVDTSSKYPIVIERFGFPFDVMKKTYTYTPGYFVFRGNVEPVGFVKSTMEFVPSGVLLNFVIYGVISFAVVKLSSKIIDKIEYYRHID